MRQMDTPDNFILKRFIDKIYREKKILEGYHYVSIDMSSSFDVICVTLVTMPSCIT